MSDKVIDVFNNSEIINDAVRKVDNVNNDTDALDETDFMENNLPLSKST